MNNKIRIARGHTSDIQSNSEIAPTGTPIYDLDEHKLYIGDGESQIKDLPTLNSEHSNTSSLATNSINSIVDKTTLDPEYYSLELVQSNWEQPSLSFKYNNLFSPQEQRKYYIPATRNILRAACTLGNYLNNIEGLEQYYSYNVTGSVYNSSTGTSSFPAFNNNFNVVVNYDQIENCYTGSWFSTIKYDYSSGSMALYTYQANVRFILSIASSKPSVTIEYEDHTNTFHRLNIGGAGSITSICPIPIPPLAQ